MEKPLSFYKSEDHLAEVHKKLEEIKSSEPKIAIYDSPPKFELRIILPYENSIRATITDGRAYIEYFIVNQELRGKGVGERLMKLLTVELKKRGIKILAGSLESVGALQTRLKIFGKENVNLHPDFEVYGNKASDKYLSFEEATENIKKGEYVECDVDLSKVDVSIWQD